MLTVSFYYIHLQIKKLAFTIPPLLTAEERFEY